MDRVACLWWRMNPAGLVVIMAVAAGWGAGPAWGDDAGEAKAILTAGGFTQGLCVHLGCGREQTGGLTAELAANSTMLVHGLAFDDASLARARQAIADRAATRASAERLSIIGGVAAQTLPYASDLVNLAVIEDLAALERVGIKLDEVLRVLAPGGVVCVRKDGQWARCGGNSDSKSNFIKPRPKEMDDWPSFDHGPDGNPVSQDTRIGLARSLRWREGPSWGVHGLDVVQGWVTADGRMFYRLRTHTPDGYSLADTLVARDAHNGLLLWQQPVKHWGDTYGDRNVLVAGGRLYTPLKPGGPLVALDPATGRVLRSYDDNPAGPGVLPPTCVLAQGETLFMSVERKTWAVDAASGKMRWEAPSPAGGQMVLAEGNLYTVAYPKSLVCLDPETGKPRWTKELPDRADRYNNPFCYRGALVVTIYAATEENKYGLACEAYSPKDGQHLWSYWPNGIFRKGNCYSGEVFGAQGLIWAHIDVEADASRNNAGKRPSAWVGLDPATGKVSKRYDDATSDPDVAKLMAYGIHRCNKAVATEKFGLFGTYEFFDWATGKYQSANITRTACGVDSGMLPANGLVYTPPFTCSCRLFAERGFLALACRPGGVAAPADDAARLERGPAASRAAISPPTTAADTDDWPVYRHDASHSGVTPTALAGAAGAELDVLWQTPVGPQLTAPTVAGGLAFVGAGDNQVVAVGVTDGKPAWRFTAGGTVDSPPTIHAGLCLFGSRDGWVYCLLAADGQLVWRFRAAPLEERIVVDGRLESAWPVNGSVLVLGGVAYFAAGRHTDMDGGVTLFAVKPATGELLWKRQLEHLPGNIERANIPVALLSTDGKSVLMGRREFDPRTGQGETISSATKSGVVRFGDPGFRDNAWFEYDNTKGCTLWSDGRAEGGLIASTPEITCGVSALAGGGAGPRVGRGDYRLFGRKRGDDKGWTVAVAMQARAIAIAGQTLVVAGPADPELPELKDEKDPRKQAAIIAELQQTHPERLAPTGGELWTFSVADGQKLAATHLDSPPVFDGLAVAGGRVFLTTQDGKLLCLGPKRK